MKREFGFYRPDGSFMYKRDMTEAQAFAAKAALAGSGYKLQDETCGILGTEELDEIVLDVDDVDFVDEDDITGVFSREGRA